MKKATSILIASVFSTIVMSCQKPPTACFTMPSTIHVNTAAKFDCTCSKNSGYYKLYIDGAYQTGGATTTGSGTLSFPAGTYPLTFTSTGNHTVMLTAYASSNKSGSGKSTNISKTVTVVP